MRAVLRPPAKASRLRPLLLDRARWAGLGWGVLVGLLTASCDTAQPTPSGSAHVRPAHESVAAIPSTEVQGRVRSTPFVARDARYVVDRRPGYEHIDILLSDAKAQGPCGPLSPAEPPRIWLRYLGPGPLPSGEFAITAGAPSPWEAHYQLRSDGRWVGSRDAAVVGRVAVADAGRTLSGALSVCFADGSDSCVSGSFVAMDCPSEIDQPVRGAEPVELPSALPSAASAPSNAAAPSSNPAASAAAGSSHAAAATQPSGLGAKRGR